MFAAFLHPFPLRGLRTPLLWVFYRLVGQLGRDVVFFLSEDYLSSTDTFRSAGRWEFSAEAQAALGYRIPTPAALDALQVEFVPPDWVESMQRRFGDDLIGPWRHFLLSDDERQQAWIEDAVQARQRTLGERFEAMFVWNNCLALRRAAANLDLPLLHWELGPLRLPQFRQTVYLDASGVNGGTECEARFRHACQTGDLMRIPQLCRADLMALLATRPVGEAARPEFEVGAPLQVDDDSNLVAYANGHCNASLIAHAMSRCSAPARLLVRNHPNRMVPLPDGPFAVDRSSGSLELVGRCERIVTINSSVGAEALLAGRPVETLGDSPYAYVARCEPGSDVQATAMRFFFLCYLVPWSLLFDPAYVRWRLGKPLDHEIAERHLTAYAAGGASP